MSVLPALLSVAVAAVFATLGTAKLAAVPSMQARAAHVGLSVDAYRRIGALEVAGALGLLVGLVVPGLAVAAGIGLVLLLLGAVITHFRVGDSVKDAAPAIVLAAVVAVVTSLVIGAM